MSAAIRSAIPAALVASNPRRSHGPFRLIESLPWLLLASSLRVTAYDQPHVLNSALTCLSYLVLCLALSLVARRTADFVGGRTNLGILTFRQQLVLGAWSLFYVALMLVAIMLVFSLVGLRLWVPSFWMVFDGIAFDGIVFDHGSRVALFWSSAIACVMLLMAVRVDRDGDPYPFESFAELARRAAWLVPAIIAVALIQFAMSHLQNGARMAVRDYLLEPLAPEVLKRGLLYAFAFAVVTVRLWVTVAVLTLALKASGGADAPLQVTVESPNGVTRFESRRWSPVLVLGIFVASIAICVWLIYNILFEGMLFKGRNAWMNDFPAVVRALVYLFPTIGMVSIAMWWFKARVMNSQYIELNPESLTVSYQNGGRPIPWDQITRIQTAPFGINIDAFGITQSRHDGHQVRISTATLKGRRKDLHALLMMHWERGA